MASLHEVTVGQDIEFKRVLAKAGMDSRLVETIIRKPQLADGMVGWLREQLAPPLPELFVSLETQLANVRRWNTVRNWGFTDADFDAVDLTPGDNSGLVVDVIVVYLPDQARPAASSAPSRSSGTSRRVFSRASGATTR